jgi:ubiquinone/menaquinone biosynthesis C-methylase UbiE
MLDAPVPRTASDRHHLATAHELKGDRCLPSVPAQLFLRQHLEQRVLRMLRRHGLWQRLPAMRVLDVGCGNGQWLVDFETWGARPERLAGIDLRRAGEARRRLPHADIVSASAERLPWPDASFDLVLQSTLFSSLPGWTLRERVADEMTRVLRPGGAILWYDLFLPSRNPDVVQISAEELQTLFATFGVDRERVTLAAPVARRLYPRAPWAAHLLRATTLLNTHYLAVLTSPRRVAAPRRPLSAPVLQAVS